MASLPSGVFGKTSPPEPKRQDGLAERYLLVARSRTPMGPGVVASIGAHLVMFGGALLYAHMTPPRTVVEKPIVAKLVRLGKPRDEQMLPRLPTAAPAPQPPPSKAVEVASDAPAKPSAPVPAKAEKAVETAPKDRISEALERQKRLMDALDRLGPTTPGPTGKTKEPLPGQLDGDVNGNAERAEEGDRYLALVQEEVRKNFVLPTTISEKERIRLSCRINIRIASDGRIADSKIEVSSGNEQFDRAVEAGIQKTKLPAPPKGFLSRYPGGITLDFKP
jgi:TonB family protein